MADRLRRRKRPSNEELSEGSAGENEEEALVDVTSEGEGCHDADDSEYESVDSETELKDEEGEELHGGGHESLTNEDTFSGGERQQGDGEESNDTSEKPLDDDEDRRNPQYIPKRGVFYEHDDRTSEKPEEKEGPPPKPEARKKKLWKDDDKWLHDKFIDGDQNPKSRDELISVYGYDIRNEESAPRARRRRRYGRGPNKYTRNWEDEEAYRKASAGTLPMGKDGEITPRGRGRGGRGRGRFNMHDDRNDNEENFPPLKLNNQNEEEGFSGVDRSGREKPGRERRERGYDEEGSRKMSPRKPPNQRWDRQDSNKSVENRTEGILPAKGRGRGRGVRPMKAGQVKEARPGRRSSKEDEQQLAQDIHSLSIEGKKSGAGRGTVPPRLQDGSSRPKRYSSQRQRTGADSYNSLPAQQTYYESSGQQGFQSNGVYNNENNNSSQPQSPQQMLLPAVPPPQPMHTGTRIFPPPPPNPPPFISAPPYAAAPPPPPGTIQYPPPGPPPPAGPVSFQAFPVPGPGPQEIYSNGVAYYNTQSQALPRTPPMKRTKAPIPIVPPPEKPLDAGEADSPPPAASIAEVQVLS